MDRLCSLSQVSYSRRRARTGYARYLNLAIVGGEQAQAMLAISS